jgi:hypothetical protein
LNPLQVYQPPQDGLVADTEVVYKVNRVLRLDLPESHIEIREVGLDSVSGEQEGGGNDGDLDPGDIGDQGRGGQGGEGVQGCQRGAGQHHQIDLVEAIAGLIEGSRDGSEPLRHLQGLWVRVPSGHFPALDSERQPDRRSDEPGAMDDRLHACASVGGEGA